MEDEAFWELICDINATATYICNLTIARLYAGSINAIFFDVEIICEFGVHIQADIVIRNDFSKRPENQHTQKAHHQKCCKNYNTSSSSLNFCFALLGARYYRIPPE